MPSWHISEEQNFQAKLENKNQMISDNFYFRGDGTVSIWQILDCEIHVVELLD